MLDVCCLFSFAFAFALGRRERGLRSIHAKAMSPRDGFVGNPTCCSYHAPSKIGGKIRSRVRFARCESILNVSKFVDDFIFYVGLREDKIE